MNISAGEVGEVPVQVVAVISTAPHTVPGGETAVICVGESRVKLSASMPPNCTADT